MAAGSPRVTFVGDPSEAIAKLAASARAAQDQAERAAPWVARAFKKMHAAPSLRSARIAVPRSRARGRRPHSTRRRALRVVAHGPPGRPSRSSDDPDLAPLRVGVAL